MAYIDLPKKKMKIYSPEQRVCDKINSLLGRNNSPFTEYLDKYIITFLGADKRLKTF